MSSAPAPTFNLFDEPWIPVRWLPAAGPAGSHPPEVGLRELLLRAHEIEQIAIAVPPALSALYRVLYAITARTTGLDEAYKDDEDDDWSERRDALTEQAGGAGRIDPARVEAYIENWHHRFDLFDPERPFLQDPRLARQCDPANTAGVDKLITTRPAGNNHAWFQHVDSASPDLPTPAQAILHLLVWHYYGPSGRCSSRTVDGVSAANSTAGPLRGSLSYHPEGTSLFETLLAGLPEPGQDDDPATDLCPWEQEELPHPIKAPLALRGPCSGLTARSQHALLLVPAEDGRRVQDAFITWAWHTGKVPRVGDPYLIWQTSKEGNPYPRPADAHRALWRDLDALLLKHPPGSAKPQQPDVFRTAVEVSEYLRVRALGFEQDGQAKDITFVDATTPPVLELAEKDDDEGQAVMVGRLRVAGELYGRRLERAVNKAWAQFSDAPKVRDCTWTDEAGARYWPAAEAEFWKRVATRDFDNAAASFRRLAEQAYDTVTHRVTATLRGAKACTAARIELYGGPVKSIPKSGGRRTPSTETP
ncbi:type I-E CRISPR-associated protein Cse1/CasA [Kitasatospora sp. NPDC004289]